MFGLVDPRGPSGTMSKTSLLKSRLNIHLTPDVHVRQYAQTGENESKVYVSPGACVFVCIRVSICVLFTVKIPIWKETGTFFP